MPDDCPLNIKFLEVVEKYPFVYDFTLQDHNKRKVVEKAWIQIGSEVNLSVDQCKEKWKNLRTALSRSMKKPPSGSSVKKKKYYLQDVMHFVLPFMKNNTQADSFLPSVEGGTPEFSNDNTNDTAESELHFNHPVQSSQQDDTQASIENENTRKLDLNSSEISKEHLPNRHSRKRACAERDENDIDKSFIDYVNLKKAKATMSEGSNPDLDFFKSLLPDLNKMSDYHKRQFKKRTLDIIDSILCDASPQNMPYVPAPTSSPALSNYSGQSYSAHPSNSDS